MSTITVIEVKVNNTQLSVEAAASNPSISPKRLLSEAEFHPGSYALFTDAYADATPDDDIPAAFDERLGARIPLSNSVDLDEHQRFVAMLKRNLPEEHR